MYNNVDVSKELVGFRLEADQIERLDKLAGALSKRSANVSVSRSSAARAALERGISELEKEYGIADNGGKAASKLKK
jgi:predicted DNA-binding protein